MTGKDFTFKGILAELFCFKALANAFSVHFVECISTRKIKATLIIPCHQSASGQSCI